MPSVRIRRLVALLSISVASLAPVPAAALADSGSSAGDQQYVDPLNPSSGSSSTPSSSSGSSGSSSASSSGSSGSTVASGSSGASPSTTAATTAAAGSGTGRTLPFTGYDGGLAAALGVGLLAGGIVLRRRLRTEH
jgi:hypothetical protein